MSIVFVFTTASFISNLSFSRQSMIETMEQDLALGLAIADDLISTKIRLLKSDTGAIAERLLRVLASGDMEAVMASQLELYPEFVSLTVYNREGVIFHHGEAIVHDLVQRENRFLQAAFSGTPIISTTYKSDYTDTLLMYVCIPMGRSMVLSAAIPGMTFADMVSKYRLWQTGNIFILDDQGTFVANYRPHLVRERHNFLHEDLDARDFKEITNFFQRMITEPRGSGTYYYGGVERLCVFSRITESNAGWSLGVVGPLNESPEANVRRGLLLSSLFFLAVGAVVSYLVSGLAAKPFLKIEEQNKKLVELNKIVQEKSEGKSQFLAQMSQEMRTPLNAVLGLSELTLEYGALSKEAQENLEKIFYAGSALLRIVNDILDIIKMESGKFELVTIEYDSPDLLYNVISQGLSFKGEKPVDFVVKIDDTIPSRLHGDEMRVKQIIINLLSNAFKFTKEGSVELDITSESKGRVTWLTIAVRDTGVGIPSEKIDNLFSDYTRIDILAHRKIDGAGLGLPVTKMVTDFMGGSISVVSEVGKGSVFIIKIPQMTVTAAAISHTIAESLQNFTYQPNRIDLHPERQRIRLPNARILIVDDIDTNLEVAKGMMSPYEMQIDCLTSGRDAVEAVREEKVKYNAIFMDYMMPGMDGIEAVRIIREEIGTPYARTVPIIALTAHVTAGNEEMFLSHGFEAVLPKPAEIARLDAIIRQWVQGKK
jgi:signal transduction histidine kinase/CheY-like chemotaxis protein